MSQEQEDLTHLKANPAEVALLTTYLGQAFERYCNDAARGGNQVKYVDAFIAVNIFHKMIVLDLVARTGLTGLYRMAVDTFSQAMQKCAEESD